MAFAVSLLHSRLKTDAAWEAELSSSDQIVADAVLVVDFTSADDQ